MLIGYLYSNPTATIQVFSNAIQLYIESDSAYLVCPGAKIRVEDYYYRRISTPSTSPTIINARVHIEYKLSKHVVSSAVKAESNGIYHNCCTALEIRQMLEALGDPQDPIQVKIDNSTAVSFSNNPLKVKCAKSWDMHLHWVKDCIKQQQFCVSSGKGSDNRADYFTKYNSSTFHQQICSRYILKGC